MNATVITQGNVYGSSRDPKYTTTDLHAAEAHEFIYSDAVAGWVENRVDLSERFSCKGHRDREVERQLQLLHEFETLRRKGTPTDHFGIDYNN